MYLVVFIKFLLEFFKKRFIEQNRKVNMNISYLKT